MHIVTPLLGNIIKLFGKNKNIVCVVNMKTPLKMLQLKRPYFEKKKNKKRKRKRKAGFFFFEREEKQVLIKFLFIYLFLFYTR